MLSQLYKSPIQSHIWLKLNPHSYLFTFWAWSNIVAFRDMSWSYSTLVIHHAHSSIKSIKSGSSEALHPPEKKEKREKEGSEWGDTLTRAKKKDKGKGWRSQDQTPLKGHSSITHMHMTSQRQDFWYCKINEEDMHLYPYLELHKSLSKSRRGFSNYLSEIQIQKRD